jgi:hypothetical protein
MLVLRVDLEEASYHCITSLELEIIKSLYFVTRAEDTWYWSCTSYNFHADSTVKFENRIILFFRNITSVSMQVKQEIILNYGGLIRIYFLYSAESDNYTLSILIH